MVRVDRDLFLPAARRLVTQEGGDVEAAARRLVDSAPRHGIDLTRCFVVLEPGGVPGKGAVVRQACLAVPGSGRTAMFFLSEPAGPRPEDARDHRERTACVEAACAHLRDALAARVRLAQALPEPEHDWAILALRGAGFTSVGTLAYMRAEPTDTPPREERSAWPAGVRVERFSDLGGAGTSVERRRADALLAEALEASYVDTLDCPELCGLRETTDVMASHRATGRWEPCMWWLVLREGEPVGCVLLNPCPEIGSVELVYLGLSPLVRGVGLADALLRAAISACATRGGELTCAVDRRNQPACRLYARHGFRRFAERIALVRAL